MKVKEPTPQYLVNQKGQKEFVVLSVKQYDEVIEDLYDLSLMAERKDEPRQSFDVFVKGLQEDGFISPSVAL